MDRVSFILDHLMDQYMFDITKYENPLRSLGLVNNDTSEIFKKI